MQTEIDLESFAAAHADGGFVLDVREGYEYETGHVPGARLVPMNSVPGVLDQLPKDETVYVICEVGGRSLAVAQFLLGHGITATSVAVGTVGWIQSGRGVVRGMEPGAPAAG